MGKRIYTDAEKWHKVKKSRSMEKVLDVVMGLRDPEILKSVLFSGENRAPILYAAIANIRDQHVLADIVATHRALAVGARIIKQKLYDKTTLSLMLLDQRIHSDLKDLIMNELGRLTKEK